VANTERGVADEIHLWGLGWQWVIRHLAGPEYEGFFSFDESYAVLERKAFLPGDILYLLDRTTGYNTQL